MAALVESEQQRDFGEAKESTLPNYCRQCDVRFACNGECPKHRFLKTPDGEPGLNYLCAGYKMFFTTWTPTCVSWRAELAADRAPANVMQWICGANRCEPRDRESGPQRSLPLRKRKEI